MILTTPYCPYGPSLLEATRAKVERILGVPTTIEYGSQMWDPTLMDPDLREVEWGFLFLATLQKEQLSTGKLTSLINQRCDQPGERRRHGGDYQ